MALKNNRKVALSEDDKAKGKYHRLDTLNIPEGSTQTIYLEGVPLMFECAIMRIYSCAFGYNAIRKLIFSSGN